MPLTPIKIFILMCGFCSRFHAIEHLPVQTVQTVQRGSDVSLRCDVPLLSESSTLHWEKDGEQISNTTLMYNNSAYIILHTVDEHSEGKYYCRLMEDGRVDTVRNHTLNVTSHSYNGKNKNRPIYRQSSSDSDVLLICKASKKYDNLKWTWEPRPYSQIDLIAFEKGIEVQLKGPIKPGRHSSTEYNSQALIFHISPVNFNYRGTYRYDTMTQDSLLHIVIIVACAVIVSVLILLGCLVFKCQQKTGADSWFKTKYISSEVLDCSTTVIYSASTAQ